jgi:formylglycine-generating enzyme required for sulfatase activity
LRLANLGKQRGSRCRDGLDGGGNGPELVVVKVGGVAPFAMTRSEISGNDISAFCNQTRLCQPPQPTLPVVNLALEKIQHYADWLTARSGFHYRLPRLEEWQVVARDDSGMADHNCRLVSGGRVLRGQRLRPADEGYANSLGLLNLFGNAEEWVQQGGDFITVGGSALTDMGNCNAAYRNSRAAPADSLRGFRLVRELAQ